MFDQDQKSPRRDDASAERTLGAHEDKISLTKNSVVLTEVNEGVRDEGTDITKESSYVDKLFT